LQIGRNTGPQPTLPEVQFDSSMRIIPVHNRQLVFGHDQQAGFFLTLSDGTDHRQFPDFAFSAGKFRETGQRGFSRSFSCENGPVLNHHGDPDALSV
jgi:hypothetical protein